MNCGDQIADVSNLTYLCRRQLKAEVVLDPENQVDMRKAVPSRHVVGLALGGQRLYRYAENFGRNAQNIIYRVSSAGRCFR